MGQKLLRGVIMQFTVAAADEDSGKRSSDSVHVLYIVHLSMYVALRCLSTTRSHPAAAGNAEVMPQTPSLSSHADAPSARGAVLSDES